MAEVVILGSGTSNGVPVLGVDYPPKFLANPKNHRTRASILIAGPKGNVLVDCSPEMRLQLLREDVKRLEAVIVTHTHADHIMGMDDLRSFCIVQRQAMPIYTLKAYEEDIRRVFPYAFMSFGGGIEVPRFDMREIEPVLNLGGLEIQTFTVMHGLLPVIALRIGDLAYITDVSEIPDGAMEKLHGLDTLILDGVRYDPHPNHFHFDRAVEVALEINAKTTYLTHLSHDYDHDVTERDMPANIRLAYDGLRIGC
jgi:phosphoribosyl 1,2-cyclic phosphate phosphodiesterase